MHQSSEPIVLVVSCRENYHVNPHGNPIVRWPALYQYIDPTRWIWDWRVKYGRIAPISFFNSGHLYPIYNSQSVLQWLTVYHISQPFIGGPPWCSLLIMRKDRQCNDPEYEYGTDTSNTVVLPPFLLRCVNVYTPDCIPNSLFKC